MIYITIESLHPELSEKGLSRFKFREKWPKIKISIKFVTFVPLDVPLLQAFPYLIRTPMV
jgi:hypothetical protein